MQERGRIRQDHALVCLSRRHVGDWATHNELTEKSRWCNACFLSHRREKEIAECAACSSRADAPPKNSGETAATAASKASSDEQALIKALRQQLAESKAKIVAQQKTNANVRRSTETAPAERDQLRSANGRCEAEAAILDKLKVANAKLEAEGFPARVLNRLLQAVADDVPRAGHVQTDAIADVARNAGHPPKGWTHSPKILDLLGSAPLAHGAGAIRSLRTADESASSDAETAGTHIAASILCSFIR